MKRIFILLLALMPFIAQAQNYKPLEPVDVPDFPTNNIDILEREFLTGGTYYTASHCLATRSINLTLEYPPEIDIAIHLDSAPEQKFLAKLHIGGVNYLMWNVMVFDDEYNGGKRVYIDIQKDHLKHIAVSGLQGITFMYNGEVLQEITYNDIEQELWRRTAEELIRAVDKFKIID